MSTYIANVVKQIEYWLRLSTFLHSGVKEALLSVLHNDCKDPTYIGLPRNPKDLFKELSKTHNNKLKQLKTKDKIIKKEQWDKLVPTSGQTDSNSFDVTLICILIINCTTLTPPATGWNHKRLPPTDFTKGAFVLRAREWRNYVNHTDPRDIDNVEFKVKWNEGEDIIKHLGYNFDTNQLLNSSLDPDTSHQQKSLLKSLDDFCKKEVSDHDSRIKDMQNSIKRFQSEYDKVFDKHKERLDKHDDELKIQQSKFDIHEGKFEILEKKIANITTTSHPGENPIEEDNKERSESPKTYQMQVISYLVSGCIFKVGVRQDYKIQSLKIKCISENLQSHWLHVKENNHDEYNDDNDDDSKNVYYEVKNLDDETILLKIQNIKDRRKYGIELQTNQHIYTDEMIIFDHDLCTHVTKDVFIVLTPPLGQFNDPLNCRHGIHGYFVEESSKLKTRISYGATVEEMTVKEFGEFSDLYRVRNFPSIKDVIQFLPPYMIFDPVIREVARHFVDLLSHRQKFRAVLTNVNSNKYIQCCMETDKYLQKHLPYHNRILVFDQETASILNVRVVQETNFNSDIHKEMEYCSMDLQYFVSSHRYHLCSCQIIGLLAFPNLNRADIKSFLSYYFSMKNKSLVNFFYLSKEDLHDVDSLQLWWNQVLLNQLKCNYVSSGLNVNSFQRICSQSMVTIALAELSPKLPTLSCNVNDQMKSLLLNPDQLKAIQSPSNRKIIIGNYGSGKSIVLDEIAKKKFYECLHTKDKTKQLLLYIVWEAYSLLGIQKDMFMEKLAKEEPIRSQRVTMISGNMHSIWNDVLKKGGQITLFDLLKYFLEESGYDVAHILIDELPTNVVDNAEILRLNRILKRHPECSLAIAPQSVIIDRKISTKNEERSHNRNCLDQMDMDLFKLVKVMRNSKQLTAAIKASQNMLDGTQTILPFYDSSLVKPGVGSKIKQKLKKWKLISREQGKETNEESSSHIGENPSSPSSPQEDMEMPTLEFDKLSKLLETDEQKKKPTSFVKSTFRYHPIENGNGITDQRPTIVKLPVEVDFNTELSSKILTLTLKELCLQEVAPTLILCNTMKEVRQASYCLSAIPDFTFAIYIPQLQGIFPSKEERLSIFSAFHNGTCIITDNTGIKGMEAKRVVIFADRNEYYLTHMINETLSRANLWVYILLHSPFSDSKYKSRQTLGDMFEDLEAKGIYNVSHVTLYDDHINFETPYDKHLHVFKVNSVCPFQPHSEQSFGDYQTFFDQSFPVKYNAENYRSTFKELTSQNEYKIVHKIQYQEKTYSFSDVYELIENEQFDIFCKLYQDNKNILNNLRFINDNSTVLIHSSFHNDLHVTRYLLEEFRDEIDVLAVDMVGRNAYHDAAQYDRVDIMKLLLLFDPSGLDVVDDSGWTALHYAALNYNKRMVECLIDAGASVDAVDSIGMTPDSITDDDDIIETIQKHRGNSSS